MDLAFTRRQAALAATTEMIVVRADDDGLVTQLRIGSRDDHDDIRRAATITHERGDDPDPRAGTTSLRQAPRAAGDRGLRGRAQCRAAARRSSRRERACPVRRPHHHGARFSIATALPATMKN